MNTDLKCVENKIVGLKQSLIALEKDNVEVLYLAKDIDINVYKKVKSVINKEVKVISVPQKKQLGEACGIDVGAACVAILKK